MRAPRFDCEFRPGSATLRLREPLTFPAGHVDVLEMLADGLPSHVSLDPRSPAAALRDRRTYLVEGAVTFTFEGMKALAMRREVSLDVCRHDATAVQVAVHDPDGVLAFCCRLEPAGDHDLTLHVSDVRHARGAVRSVHERLRRIAASLAMPRLDPPWRVVAPLSTAVATALALRGWRAPRARYGGAVIVLHDAIRVTTRDGQADEATRPSEWAKRLAELDDTTEPADPCRWVNAEVWVLRAAKRARADDPPGTIEAASRAMALGGDQLEVFTQACEHVASVGAADQVVRWVDGSSLPTARRIGVLRASVSAADTESTREVLGDAVAARGGNPTTLVGEELFWP